MYMMGTDNGLMRNFGYSVAIMKERSKAFREKLDD